MDILIIEDDASIAELEKTYLEFYGYAVDIAETAAAGLTLFEEKTYDMVIVDVMLPGEMDGLDFCREVRRVSDVPMMVVSAKADDADKISALGLGIDDYLTKPFNTGELVARVKAHISRYEALTSRETPEKRNVTKVRDLAVDRDSRRVTVRGREVRFTEKEYQLLLFFIDHPDVVFTRDQLFDHIWGMESFGDISTVTVHVKKIRDKLETPENLKPYIETIWGVGYRFLSD